MQKADKADGTQSVDGITTILIIGGAGRFGRRLTDSLLATTDCRIVVAGRTRKDAVIADFAQK